MSLRALIKRGFEKLQDAKKELEEKERQEKKKQRDHENLERREAKRL